ncbi:MAG: HAMP domain-containing histidine kinase [Thermoleophilaceae bacterium]|nr:HAMP domain-containing histidine kinase [Thermoleophilaceae bacterium]
MTPKRALGPLQRRFAAGVLLAFVVVGAVVLSFGALMLVPTDDEVTLVVALGVFALLAVLASALIARGVLRDVERVRDGLAAVGLGERGVMIETAGGGEIAELADEANEMIARLGEREEERDAAESSRRHLVAAVSHDLRTPLAAIQALGEAIEDDVVDDSERRRYLALMSVHVRALGALIEDLFELSRLEAGDIEWSMQQVRLDELVSETVEAMRPAADERGVLVRTEVPAGIAPAHGNPEKLQRVLFNLIQNAIRHTPSDGSVAVRAQANGANVEVEVADTGEGITGPDRDRIFVPFFRGGGEAPRTRSGAGLGLPICRAIVEAHGGMIWLEEAETGARVRFSLKLAEVT